ncbi:uncharacterized protein RAG0_01517 [Rhynchosporium agropyri]|uniref:Uncharacterized protein n=1 Tax=Rhynchosporium agropyri TaxID=914238 RepID=A0A1E1JXQ2_9HELO|nr:uncharacterized protein RAG0_01517 [Rhynchosporium agropyri]
MNAFHLNESEAAVDIDKDCEFDVDDEIFSDKFHTTTKAEISSPVSSVSSEAPRFSSSLTLPIRQLPVYIHAQCGHQFQSTNFPGDLLEVFDPTNMSQLTSRRNLTATVVTSDITSRIRIVNPRSCLLCIWHEEQRIIASTNYSCELIENSSITEEHKDRAIAYQNGLESGRLLALKRSLEWCQEKGSSEGGEVAWAMRGLLERLRSEESLKVLWIGYENGIIRGEHARAKGIRGLNRLSRPEMNIEELVALIEESSLTYCEGEYELRFGDELEEIEYLGKKAGIGLQARMDGKAIKNRLF